MKKTLFTFALMLVVMAIQAQTTFTVGNLKYTVLDANAKTVSVTGHDNASGVVVIPSAVSNGGVRYTVTDIGDRAFYGNSALEGLTIPASVTTYHSSALWSVYSGKNFVLTIEDSNVPLTVTRGSWCTVENPASVELYMGRNLVGTDVNVTSKPFFGANLTSVEFGPMVTEIMAGLIWNGNTKVTTVKTHAVKPVPLPDESFHNDVYAKATLWVPTGTKAAYTAAANWKRFANIQTWTPPTTVLIASAADWKSFANAVQENPVINAKMTADVNLGNDQTMVGTEEEPYQGHFDGQGHTLTVNYDTSIGGTAPFWIVKNATIEGLHVAGSIHTSRKAACGIVGACRDKEEDRGTIIRRCWVSALLTTDDDSNGGIISEGAYNTLIEDCLFDGKFADRDNFYCGGFVNYSRYPITIRNGLNIGTFPAYRYHCGTFIRTDAGSRDHVLENDYYLKAYGLEQGTQISEAQLADGTVTGLLQAGRGETVWVQDKATNRPIPAVFATTSGQKEAYAVVNGSTLTFYYDGNKSSRAGKKYAMNTGINYPDWAVDSLSIRQAVIDASFKDYRPTTTARWFERQKNLTAIQGLSNLNTSSATSTMGMFYECNALQSLDVSGFDTRNVIDMRWMFCGCSALKSLNVTKFNTTKVRSMHSMFEFCESLTSLDLSSFDTSNVEDMGWMFCGCSELKSLSLKNFNTSKVNNMLEMFCYDSALTSLDLSSFDTSNVEDMSYMFYGCGALKSINLKNFNTAKVATFRAMFYQCASLESIDVGGFNTSSATDMGGMFYECSALKSIDVSNFNTEKVTSMRSMFCYDSALTSLDLSSFNTGNVTNMEWVFYDCKALRTIYASNSFTTAKVTSSKGMFMYCTSLVGGQGTRYNENNVDHTYARIDGGTSAPGYFTYKASSKKGDVNGDGAVNVADIATIIDVMAGTTSNPRADVNGDGSVNVADIATVIDIMAGK